MATKGANIKELILEMQEYLDSAARHDVTLESVIYYGDRALAVINYGILLELRALREELKEHHGKKPKAPPRS